MQKRIFIRKRELFRNEDRIAEKEWKSIGIDKKPKIYIGYDIQTKTEKQQEVLIDILADPVTDTWTDYLDEEDYTLIVEYQPSQFDQRAEAALESLALLEDAEDVFIRSFVVYQSEELNDEEKEKIENYIINPIEMRKKNMDKFAKKLDQKVKAVPTMDGFINMNEEEIKDFLALEGFSINFDDLIYIQKYFKDTEKRDPTETELKVLDTYWSDHCRHTTFETSLENIQYEENIYKENIKNAWSIYKRDYEKTGAGNPHTLMDLATRYGKTRRAEGKLDDMEVSEEINAIALYVDVETKEGPKPWILQFKNETHNHPTEIEPYGGAGTCLGGAIRDPLSGRSYIYQAMRITGAGDINAPIESTLTGKLPQSLITKKATEGFSDYGAEIGLPATYVEELYHPDYIAKRMEVGAVAAASPAENIYRGNPEEGDIVVLLGGKTGRDGVGGASGSSKEHTEDSMEESSSEVQKGNAQEERKIQRLMRNGSATKMIIRSNDFGAGGVSVSVGEIADGVHIDLDAIPVKYEGLSGTEIAISESQERLAAVIAKEDFEEFKKYCEEENLTATIIAKVTKEPRVIMDYKGQRIVDISREFVDTAGVRRSQEVIIGKSNGVFPINELPKTKEDILNNLKNPNIASQKGMTEYFNSSTGRSTVLYPYGGKTANTAQEASVQTLPVPGGTDTASVFTYGFDPYLSAFEPYLGAQYAVIESLSRHVAVGSPYRKCRLSGQEYFERLEDNKEKWGKVVKALLGFYEAQNAFETPAIGGKDSMSGSFDDLHVPPTLISFAITLSKASKTISAELKGDGYLYLVPHEGLENNLPDYDGLKENWDKVLELNEDGKILSAKTIKYNDPISAIITQSLGNEIGLDIKYNEKSNLPGALIIETSEKIDDFIYLGETGGDKVKINDIELNFGEINNYHQALYKDIYPLIGEKEEENIIKAISKELKVKFNGNIESPKVIIPVFPGNSGEYELKEAFEKEGAEGEIYVLRTQDIAHRDESLRELAEKIKNAEILALPGGAVTADEPNGAAKYSVNILNIDIIRESVEELLERGGLILGIGNGFQALLKTGLLPYGEYRNNHLASPTLFYNDIGRRVSKMVRTKITSKLSPWLKGFDEIYTLPFTANEGKFIASNEYINKLAEKGQIASVYVDDKGEATMDPAFNPSGSFSAIEGITSEDGRIFGRMTHNEDYRENLLKNVPGEKEQNIFKNAVEYFRN